MMNTYDSARLLTNEERDLIAGMIEHVPDLSIICDLDTEPLVQSLNEAKVVEMADGGTSSLLFLPKDQNKKRHFGGVLAEAYFKDIDGIPISIVINLDRDHELYELDIWKVDSSALKRFPNIAERLDKDDCKFISGNPAIFNGAQR